MRAVQRVVVCRSRQFTENEELSLQEHICSSGALRRTSAVGTLEMKAGGMPNILRKQRFCKPSRRQRSVEDKHQRLREYISFDSNELYRFEPSGPATMTNASKLLELKEIPLCHPDSPTKFMPW